MQQVSCKQRSLEEELSTGSDLLTYFWDVVIRKSTLLRYPIQGAFQHGIGNSVFCLRALGNIPDVHKYRLYCLKLQVKNQDFLVRPFKCWALLCHHTCDVGVCGVGLSLGALLYIRGWHQCQKCSWIKQDELTVGWHDNTGSVVDIHALCSLVYLHILVDIWGSEELEMDSGDKQVSYCWHWYKI